MTTINLTVLTIRRFAHEHDDLPAFHAGYLVLTVLVAALFNLGAFAVLILAHVSLDIVKYREVHQCNWRRTMEGVFHENVFDVLLLAIGFVFAVYFHHTGGIAGVSGVMRADVTIFRAFGTLIPKVEILQDFLKVTLHLSAYLRFPHSQLGSGWSQGERLCLFFLSACVILLISAPFVQGMDASDFGEIIAREVAPWRF
ncbi:MAG: hypothetical protein PHE68_03745 [Candidatus Peribacteraceae bacterium]|nr:hypothetical protein [Candidatus Peribacteraceae bacterium]MDD5075176.1 hypothetical protein [Candidatus Peribacteraceae bacterium]